MVRPDKYRILGVDPGSRATGYGVIEKDGNRLHFIACGVIRATNRSMTFPERLKTIHDGLCEVIKAQDPVVAAVEDVFVAVNPRSALKSEVGIEIRTCPGRRDSGRHAAWTCCP
jgi:crossover junction endodeoxyribonuclease RuvC